MKQDGERNERPEQPVSGVLRAATDTVKLTSSTVEASALAVLRASLPPLDPITEEREIQGTLPRRDTPHTFVLPVVVNPDRATLIMLGGPDSGATFALEGEETTFGRGSTATVQIDEPSISREHARISRDDGGRYVIEDLGSTNGTFVSGRRVRRVALRTGDRIQLGRDTVFRFAIVDQTEESFQRRLYESSMRDTLTGVANRRCLFERLGSELSHARREGGDVAVVLLDIDHFKRINDTFGHLAGDQVLRSLALTCEELVRAGDVFARYGGEEFAVIARDASREEAAALAERLRKAIEDLRINVGDEAVSITVSIGVAHFSESVPDDDGLELFARADTRMYAAKIGGRNRVATNG